MPIWKKVNEYPPESLKPLVFRRIETGHSFTGWFNKELMEVSSEFGDLYEYMEGLEYLDESEPSFSISEMRDAFEAGTASIVDMEFGSLDYKPFNAYMKESFNIDIKE